MREGAEGGARAVAVLLDVVAARRLVDLRVELLLGARVAVLAAVPVLAVGRVAPLIRLLHVRTRRGPARAAGGRGYEDRWETAPRACPSCISGVEWTMRRRRRGRRGGGGEGGS